MIGLYSRINSEGYKKKFKYRRVCPKCGKVFYCLYASRRLCDDCQG
jgi:rRNA maturation endonuclease Nob1